MAADTATSSQSYQEFVKFGKFFTTRMVQAVVQSRLGQLISQACSAQPDTSDWFNIRVDELGEIAAHMRANIFRYPPISNSLTLDFLLHTADGDILPLESWCISFDPSNTDDSVNIRTQLYHQLGTMLKSAMAASRATPMYRYYVRKQSSDTFIILYRVYESQPEADLGEEQRKVRIGTLTSPFGGLSVDLSYRTRMEINRSLHQAPEASTSAHVSVREETHVTRTEQPMAIPFGKIPLTAGTVEAVSPVSDIISNFSTSPASQGDLPFATSPPRRSHFRLGRSVSSSDESTAQQPNSDNQSCDEHIFGMDGSNSCRFSNSLPQKPVLHVNPPRSRTHSFPFAVLLTAAPPANVYGSQQLPLLPEDNNDCVTPSANAVTICANDAERKPSSTHPLHHSATVPATVNLMKGTEEDEESLRESRLCGNEASSGEDEDNMISSDDSFVKVAFASSENLDSDLGEFVKQCRLAPSHLQCFRPENSSDIPFMLAEFETNQKIFDNFVSDINARGHSEDS